MLLELTAIYEPQPDGWIAASIAEIPGVLTQGSSIGEARDNLSDALAQILDVNRELRLAEATPGATVEPFGVKAGLTA